MHQNFWGQKWFFFWGGAQPLHHTQPSLRLRRLAPSYWNPKYATAPNVNRQSCARTAHTCAYHCVTTVVYTIQHGAVLIIFVLQGGHSPDSVKFPDNSMTFPMISLTVRGNRHAKYYSYHATVHDSKPKWNAQVQPKPRMNANTHLTINSFKPLFPDNSPTLPWLLVKSVTFPWQLSNSLTFPGFPDKWSPWVVSSRKSSRSDVLYSQMFFTRV